MGRKEITILSIVFLVAVMLTGCSNVYKNENNTFKKEIAEVKDNNAKLEMTISELQNKLALKEEELKAAKARETTFQNKKNIYSIYTLNIYTFQKEIDGYVYLSNSISLIQKLDILANILSEVYFDNLPIQIIKIEEVDKKKVAVVNLCERKENQGITNSMNYKGKSWACMYFQGSTGGYVTSTQLIETFLQRDYKDQWIDGVRFLYNNGPCDYEHAPELNNINYRIQ